MKKKIILILNLITCFTIKSQVIDSFDKINYEYFKTLTPYDNINIYTIIDNGDLYFNYIDQFPGANDYNFVLQFTRHIRLKLNKLNNQQDNNLVLFSFNDNNDLNKVRVSEINLFNIENKKVIKTKVSSETLNLQIKDNTIFIDLNSIVLRDSSLLDIKIIFNDLSKNSFTWTFQNPFYVINSIFTVSIPEIYQYDQTFINSDNYEINNEIVTTPETLIGYYIPYSIPEVNYAPTLVTPSFYRATVVRHTELLNAKAIYCKYTEYKYKSQNLPKYENRNNACKLELKLLSINPIN